MVRHDHLNQSFIERSPKLLAVLSLSDRRAAFELSRAVRNLFGCEEEIVRASLNSNLHSFTARFSQSWKRIGRRMMNDMNASARLAAQANHQIDGSIFGLARARFKKRGILARVGILLFIKRLFNRLWNFRVHNQHSIHAR